MNINQPKGPSEAKLQIPQCPAVAGGRLINYVVDQTSIAHKDDDGDDVLGSARMSPQ